MAGIGLKLRAILREETYSATVRAYALGAVLVMGPFLCSVVCLALLGVLGISLADTATRQTFASAVVYVFGGSLVSAGLLQVVVTRYIADAIYRGAYGELPSSLFPMLLVTAGLHVVSGVPVLIFTDLSPLASVTVLALYVTIGCLWIVIPYWTSASGHVTLVVNFAIGTALALGAGAWLLGRFGLEGLLIGYTAGHFLILIALIEQLLAEFGRPSRFSFAVLGYVRRFPMLVFIGAFGALGTWIDKFLFWTSDLSLAASGFVTAPKYDSSMFLGFLTAVPAMVHFFVRIEADFSAQFHQYYDEVFFRSDLDQIGEAAKRLREAVIDALLDILKVQGVVTFLAAFFGVEILSALGLPVSQIGLFRYGVVGSLFLVFMVFSNVVLLYLDCQRQVLAVVSLFLGVNLISSAATLELGYQFYGLGFATASLVALIVSLTMLMRQLYNLEFVTFATLPLMGQRRASRGLRARAGGGFGVYHDLDAMRRDARK